MFCFLLLVLFLGMPSDFYISDAIMGDVNFLKECSSYVSSRQPGMGQDSFTQFRTEWTQRWLAFCKTMSAHIFGCGFKASGVYQHPSSFMGMELQLAHPQCSVTVKISAFEN